MENYLIDLFGENEVKIYKNKSKKFPLYLKELYEIYDAEIQGTKYTFLFYNEDSSIVIRSISKQFENLKAYGINNPVLILNRVSTEQRQRYIANRIPYIVPYKQVYLPNLYLNIDDRMKSVNIKRIKKFSPSTQLVFILLMFQKEKSIHSVDIRKKLNISLMTVSRALRDLVSIDLLTVDGVNTGKRYTKIDIGDFWKIGKKYLDSPIIKTFYIKELPKGIITCYSSDSAISNLTMINEDDGITYAVDKQYKDVIENVAIEKDFVENNVSNIVEIWSYNPQLFADENGNIDFISLYSIFKDTDDPRIEIELDNLQKEFLK
ncbi:hypothetical protein [Breznakia pachnodae]|uniref:hypothetical protein n=1 Tax=Breznakia pachnodae TaxID=265178 RepID=UPI0027D855DC|nr:hypothetical protein [Breznakia pachnodae]